MHLCFAVFVAVLSFNFSLAYQLDEAEIRRVYAKAMRCQNITQLHSAVVHDNQTLYSFRLRLNSDGSVSDITDRRILSIASVSKGMFCSALVRLEQQLKSNDPNFDLFATPVKRFMGDDFWFLDQHRTDTVTLQDLVSHVSGLSVHNQLSKFAGVTSKEDLMRQTGRLKPSTDFRTSFIYNNLCFGVADFVVQNLTGKNFSSYMREYLWKPLNMTSTISSSERDERGGPDAVRTSIDQTLNVTEASGGIYPTLDDMIKYMIYHASKGYNKLQQPTKPFKAVNPFQAGPNGIFTNNFFEDSVTDLPEEEMDAYGYGFNRGQYRGELVYHHSGSTITILTELLLLPRRKLAVFTNSDFGNTYVSFTQMLYSTLLNKFVTDLLIRNASFVTEDNVCRLLKPVLKTQSALPLRELTPREEEICVGSFGDFGFGTVVIFKNSSSGLLNARYGFARIELLPVIFKPEAASSSFEFFSTIAEPTDIPMEPELSSVNETHAFVNLSPSASPTFYLRIWQQDGSVFMNSPMLEPTMNMRKGLDPSTWQRPTQCPESKSAAGIREPLTCKLLLLMLLLMLMDSFETRV